METYLVVKKMCDWFIENRNPDAELRARILNCSYRIGAWLKTVPNPGTLLSSRQKKLLAFIVFTYAMHHEKENLFSCEKIAVEVGVYPQFISYAHHFIQFKAGGPSPKEDANTDLYFLVANSNAIHYCNIDNDYIIRHDMDGTIVWNGWGEGLNHPLSRWERVDITLDNMASFSIVAVIANRSWKAYFMMNLPRVDM